MIGTAISLLSIPMLGLAIRSLRKQMREEQRLTPLSPIIGLVMGPLMLGINLLFFGDVGSPGCLGAILLLLGLVIGVVWGQTTKLRHKAGQVVGRRSAGHMVFWGISYAITQLLASFASAGVAAAGLATMFFSCGTSVGTSANLLIRLLVFKLPSVIAPSSVPERRERAARVPPPLPERPRAAALVPPGLPERRKRAVPPGPA